MTVGRLHFDGSGRLVGPADIEYNNPFPCVNGSWGGAGSMNGVVMHTMVGDLPGAINVFNDPAWQASAFFGIAQDGLIHQFGPVGKNWEAWAQCSGNSNWYSIEHADHADPHNPLTTQQLNASAQIVEALSAYAGFPLQVTDSTSGHGYGVHNMGGAAWGGHSCPDYPYPGAPFARSTQRQTIINIAKDIRGGKPVPTPPAPGPVIIGRPYLVSGATGPGVVKLQTCLNKKGAKPVLAEDGDFGPATLAAVKAFQKASKLVVDGEVGPLTWAALLANGSAK